MEHLVTTAVSNYGYLAVFLLMVAESACIPVPSEVTMLFGGALANATFVSGVAHSGKPLNFVLVGLLGTLGNLVGSWIAWAVGFRGGRPLIDRFGRYVLLREHEIDRAEAWFDRYGPRAVFVSRLLPVVRTFISLPAGTARMRFGRFTLYTVLGCLPWTFALAGVGYALGSQWTTVARWFRPISYLVAAVIAVLIIVWFARRLSLRRRERALEHP